MKSQILKFLLLFILQYSILNSQETWEHVYDPFPVDAYLHEDAIKCTNGGYVFNGSCQYEDPFNPGCYEQSFGYTMKVNNEGLLEWVNKDSIYFSAFTVGSALTQTADNGFVSAVIFPGALIKRDSDGNAEWIIDTDWGVHSLTDTEDGNFIATGYAPWEENNLRKYSLDGSLLFGKRIRASQVNSIVRSADGGYIVAGVYYGQNEGDVVVAKTDANGDTLWTKYLDGYGEDDIGRCVFENSIGEIIVVGDFSWSPGFIWKLDQEGETLDLEIVNPEISLAIFNANEYLNDFTITWGSGPNYIARFNRFDCNLNYIDSMLDISSGLGDKGFIIDGNHIIRFGGSGITIIKETYNPVSISDELNYSYLDCKLSNYPNPFNPQTTIKFSIPEESKVKLTIYNIRGQRVKTLVNDDMEKGIHEIIWVGKNDNNKSVASGVYFYKFDVNDKMKSVKKCLMLK